MRATRLWMMAALGVACGDKDEPAADTGVVSADGADGTGVDGSDGTGVDGSDGTGADGTDGTEPGLTLGGTEYFSYGKALEVADPNCVLTFSLQGEQIDAPGCPDCTYAFEIDSTLDEERTFDDGTCSALASDAVLKYGFTLDFEGYARVLYFYDGDWTPFAYTDFDGSPGPLIWYTGYIDRPITYDGEPQYWTYYWFAEATLAEP